MLELSLPGSHLFRKIFSDIVDLDYCHFKLQTDLAYIKHHRITICYTIHVLIRNPLYSYVKFMNYDQAINVSNICFHIIRKLAYGLNGTHNNIFLFDVFNQTIESLLMLC